MPLYIKKSTSSILQRSGSVSAGADCCCLDISCCGCTDDAPRKFQVDLTGFTDDDGADIGVSGICGDAGTIACGSQAGTFVVPHTGAGCRYLYTGGGYSVTVDIKTISSVCYIEVFMDYRASLSTEYKCRIQATWRYDATTAISCPAISGLDIPFFSEVRHPFGQNDCISSAATCTLTAL